ncbi:MAG TPA: autotransporter-associated beta strand repeat-containing protein [Thermoanaerobaculia bacterium]|jgi:autotransporter-associated beta strand protein|nr:autotransporter-associated beta strand repeat-containing protein [Thermoanaerobaculia bacterium]
MSSTPTALRRGILVAVTVAVASVATRASAASHTWSGAGANANWSTAANWSAGGAPAMAETNVVLVFPASPQAYLASNDVSGLQVTSVTISDNGYVISGNAVTLSNAITVDAPAPSDISWAIPIAFPSALSVAVTASGTFFTMSGALSGGALAKTGAGELILSGANTYTGATNVNGGTLTVANSNALGGAATGTTVASGAVVTIKSGTAGISIPEPLTLNGSGIGGTGALRALDGDDSWSGPIVLNTADATIGDVPPGFLRLTGTLSGPGGLTTAGPGNIIFEGQGDNSYAGPTLVLPDSVLSADQVGIAIPGNLTVQGAFIESGSNQLATTSNLSVTNVGVTPEFDLAIGNQQTIASLTLTGGNVSLATSLATLTLNGNVTTLAADSSSEIFGPGHLALGAAPRTFTVADGPADDDLIVDAVITGAGLGIVKAGPGRMVLTGSNTYSGATTVNAGTLVVNGSQPFSNVTVNSGGTLGGSGTVRNITGNSGGVVSPGSSPGILSAGPLVTLGSGSTLAVEIDGTTAGALYDRLSASGTATITGCTLLVLLGYSPAMGDSFTILQATTVTGTFASLPEGATLCAGGVTLTIHYTAATVTLTVTSLADGTSPSVTPPAGATVTQTTCQ